jgi:hypothetical protein
MFGLSDGIAYSSLISVRIRIDGMAEATSARGDERPALRPGTTHIVLLGTVGAEDRFQERSIKPSQQGAAQKRQNSFDLGGHVVPYPTIDQSGPPQNAMRSQLIAE